MSTVVLVLFWLAATYRVWVSATQPVTLWRSSFTITACSVAAAFTLHELRAQFDVALGVPGLAGVAARVIMLIGVGFLLVYHEHLRQADVPKSILAAHLSLASLVIAFEILAWSLMPSHARATDDLLSLAAEPSVVLYCVTFWLYLALVLAVVSRTCLAGGRTFRRTDPARSVSLLLIGVAELLGIPVLLLWTASMLLRHQGASGEALNRLGDVLLPWPVLLDAIGVLCLLAVPYLAALLARWRQWRRLRPLWTVMVQRYPQVHLNLKVEGGPLSRLQLRVERAVIEIRDALRMAPTTACPEHDDVIEVVARSLGTRSDSPISAAQVLGRSETREADMGQLLDLAEAYERVGHARA